MNRGNLSVEVAILVSLLLHVAVIGGWEQRDQLAKIRWLQPVAKLAQRLSSPSQTAASTTPVAAATAVESTLTFVEEKEPTPPQIFMETDASQETGAKPDMANYYSDRSTVAANPENPTGKTSDTPYLEGDKESPVLSTVDVLPDAKAPLATPAVKAQPLIPPSPPQMPTPTASKPVEVVKKPKEVPLLGLTMQEEIQMAQAEPASMTPPPSPLPPYQVLPRSLPTPPQVAVPELPPSPLSAPRLGGERQIAARKSRLTGSGTSRLGIAAFNVAENPFGRYDRAIVQAVQSRWYALIEQNHLYERSGHVTLRFQLLDDGTVQAMEVKENTAGEVLALFCEKAIVDSAPFEPLPDHLRVLIGKEPREVNFTFYY